VTDINWVEKEFSRISLRDERLNKRFLETALVLASRPGFSVNKACEDWASTKAAYRLFDNPKVTPEDILAPHIENTIQRAKKFPFIVAIQDSSGVNFTDHNAKKGFGYLGVGDPRPDSKSAQGLYMHPTLAVSPDGLPLGLLNNYFWKRDKNDIKEDKESIRWTKSLESVVEHSKGKLNILTVADREGDINDFFLSHLENHQHFLVRSKHNRKIMESGKKLHEYLRTMPVSLSFEKEVQNKRGKNNRLVKKSQKGRFKNEEGNLTRIAHLNIQFTQVNIILDSGHRNRADIEVPVTAIRVFESPRDLEEGEYLIDWILLTSLEIKDKEYAKLMVDYYSMRWRIEEYFKILKSGCKIEDSRYETYDRTVRFISLLMVIAWRIFFMSHLKRVCPKESCKTFLSDSEWKALYCKIHKTKKLPESIPTVEEAITWIAKLGGFLNRKSDGDPGNNSIWTGFRRLNDMVSMWEILSRD